MAENIVGTAFVVVRALTQGVRDDIKRGFDRGVEQSRRDVDRSGQRLGERFGQRFSRSAGNELQTGLGEALDRGFRTVSSRTSRHLTVERVRLQREINRLQTNALKNEAAFIRREEVLRERAQTRRIQMEQRALDALKKQRAKAHADALKDQERVERQRTRLISNSIRRETQARIREINRAHAEALKLDVKFESERNRLRLTNEKERRAAAIAEIKTTITQAKALEREGERVSRTIFRFYKERQRGIRDSEKEVAASFKRIQAIVDRAAAPFAAAGRGAGRRFGRAFGHELALEIRRFPILPFFVAAFAPVAAGLAKIVAAFAGELVSLLAPIGPAFAAAVAVGATGFTALAQGVGVLTAALKAETDLLVKYKERWEETKETLRGVAENIQAVLLEPLNDDIDRAVSALLPRFNSEMVQTGRVLRDAADGLADLSEDPFFQARFGTILASNNRTLEQTGRATTFLADALVTVLSAASPLTEQFARYVASVAQGWAESLRLAQASGELADWFRRQGEFLQQLGRITSNTRQALSEMFRIASRDAENLWSRIEGLTERWRDFTRSTEGRNRIADYLDRSREVAQEVNRLFGDMFRLLGQGLVSNSQSLVEFVRALRLRVLPAVADMSRAFAGLGPVFTDLVVTGAEFFAVLADTGIIGTFISTMRDAFQVISDLLSLPVVGQIAAWSIAFLAFGKALNIVTLGAFTRALGPLVGRIAELGTAFLIVGRQAATAAGGAGIGALRGSFGLLAGAMGGPLGIALTGLTVGLGFLLKAHIDAKNAAAEHESKLLDFAGTLDSTTGAVTDQTRQWVAAEAESRGFLEAIRRLGLEERDLVQAATGSADAQERLNEAMGDNLAGETALLFSQFNDAAYDAVTGMESARFSQEDLTEAMAAGGDELERFLTRAVLTNQITPELADKIRDASGSHRELAGFVSELNGVMSEEQARLEAIAAAAGSTSENVRNLAEDLSVLGDEFASVDEKARALDDALRILEGGERDVEESNRRLHQTFRDVEDALVDTTASADAGKTVYLDLASAINESTGKLDQTTEVGAVVADTYDRMFRDASNAALAIAATGAEAGEVRVPFDEMIGQFRGLLETAGATPPQIDAIISSLQSMPVEAIVDLILNSDEFDDPIEAAENKLNEINGMQAIAELLGDDADLAYKILENSDNLNEIDSIIATATADLDASEAAEVRAEVLRWLAELHAAEAIPKAKLDPGILEAEIDRINGRLNELHEMRPTPEVRAEIGVFEEQRALVQAQLNELNARQANPKVGANATLWEERKARVQDQLDALDGQRATPTILGNSGPFNSTRTAVQAAIDNLHGQRPTPTVMANPGPFYGTRTAVQAAIDRLHGQRPTPTVLANPAPFNRTRGQVQGSLNSLDRASATPTVRLNDQASGPIARISSAIHQLPSQKTIYISVVGSGRTAGFLEEDGGIVGAGGRAIAAAAGGIFQSNKSRLIAAANGLFARREPMVAKGGANILWAEPETHAESYIPWALSKRTRATRILRRTAREFGYQLNPMAEGGIVARTQSLLAQSSTGTASQMPNSAAPVFQFTVDGPEVQYRAEQIAMEAFKQFRRHEAVLGRIPRG